MIYADSRRVYTYKRTKGGAGKLRESEDIVNNSRYRRPSKYQGRTNRQRTTHIDQDRRSIGQAVKEQENSKKVRTEVNKAGPTKVAIVLLGTRDSNPGSVPAIVTLQVDISSRTK